MKQIIGAMVFSLIVALLFIAVRIQADDPSVKDALPHAKMPYEFLETRLLELDIGQEAWIEKHCIWIDKSRHIWIDPEGEVYMNLSEAAGTGLTCLKVKRVANKYVELMLPLSHQKAYPKIMRWKPRDVSHHRFWKVSAFTVGEKQKEGE